jgi:ketol-acid reductoisomerase
MSMVYREDDGDLSFLDEKFVAVIGYGSLGRPFALNLRDSGVRVLVGTRTDESRAMATDDGFPSMKIEEVVKKSHILMMMLPDEDMAEYYLPQISPYLMRGQMLVFSSAYNVTFGYIEAPPFVDVALLAPRIPANAVRERYEGNKGFLSFVAVGQDASGTAWNTLLALAKATGSLKAGAVELSFERETELDLFAQQTLLPAFYHILMTAANVLLARGYPPEAVLTELYLSGEISHNLEQAAHIGLLNTLKKTTLTNQYGTFSRMDRFNELKLERLMEVTLDEIHTGDFAKEWMKEFTDGGRRLKTLLKNQESLEIWELEQQTLDMLGRETDFNS